MRWFAALLLGICILFIARLTLADPLSSRVVFSLADAFATRVSHGRLQWTETEILANVALFVPAGFLLTVVVGRPFLSVALCVLGSACIELAQQRYLPSRVPTLADIQHNSLGGGFGALLAWPVAKPLFGRRQYAVTDTKQPKVA
jgi:glycopeptide antibiotics resistance protein